jgi:hypothetical protein
LLLPRSTIHKRLRLCAYKVQLVLQLKPADGRWIGRDGPMPWPPRSPDITPLDFFLWGYVKSSGFRTPVNGLDDLKTRSRNAISAIPADMLHRTYPKSSNIV